jgi:hypothetical protein
MRFLHEDYSKLTLVRVGFDAYVKLEMLRRSRI